MLFGICFKIMGETSNGIEQQQSWEARVWRKSSWRRLPSDPLHSHQAGDPKIGFDSGHVWTWELDYKKAESWRTDAFKLWCWRRLLSPLDCKEIKPVNPKVDRPWIFLGRTDAEAEAPILWPPDAKSQLIAKVPDTGKDWGQEEKRGTEDEMAG